MKKPHPLAPDKADLFALTVIFAALAANTDFSSTARITSAVTAWIHFARICYLWGKGL